MRSLAVLGVLATALALAPPAGADPARVAAIQVALQAKGLYRGAVDGVAGPRTHAAVRKLQRRARLSVDGVVGPRTRRAFGPLGRPLFGSRTLVRGAVGWDVSILQFLLARHGWRGRPDGRFGPATARAVVVFQRAGGLAADGVVGPATIAALRGRAVLTPRGRPTARPTGRRYVVQAGDTLTGVASRFRTSVSAVARANRLDPRGFLFEGAVLRIPAPTPGSPSHGAVRALLDRWAAHYGVDARLVRALAWQESGYQHRVVSSAGALGVMQVTPGTWEFVETVLLGTRVPRTADGNVRVGVLFLRHLLRQFRWNERLAVGAYYQGARSVRRRGLLPETRRYVANVLALKYRV